MKTMLVLTSAILAAGWTTKDDGEDPAALLNKAGISLSEAVQKAIAIAGEGTVVGAELEDEDGKVIFSVEVARGDKILEVNLDAKTGEKVNVETEKEDKSAVAKALKIGVAQAIETALQKKPGLAFAAEAEVEDGKPEVEVQILSEGKVWKVEVDGTSGVAGTPKAKKSEKKEEKGEKK
jgi:uncharacterized membrane protein YkoI